MYLAYVIIVMKKIDFIPLVKIPRGGALVLTAAASASVLLSVLLLFGYVSDTSDRQNSLEESVQASLAEETAIDYATFMYRDRISSDEVLPSLETGGFVSSFRMIETAAASRTISYEFPGVTEITGVNVSSGIIIAGRKSDSLSVHYRIPGHGAEKEGFSYNICYLPDNWVLSEAAESIEPICILICDYPSVDGLFTLFRDGSSRAYSLGDFGLAAGALITSGMTEDGPAAVITDGFNSGIIINLDDGLSQYMVSVVGTCPVIFPDGRIFGEISSKPYTEHMSDTESEIRDIFFGDFDLDGSSDAAWAGSDCLTCFSSARNTLVKDDSVSGELAAWGFLEGRYGLGGLWLDGNAGTSWRKFIVTGFSDLEDGEILLQGFEGRILTDGNNMAAIRGESRVIAADSSGQNVFSVDSGIAGDFDGSGILDIAVFSDELVSIHPDPAGPEGILLKLEITTGIDPDMPISSVICLIHTVDEEAAVSDRIRPSDGTDDNG